MHFLWPSTGIHEYRSICTRCADIRAQTLPRVCGRVARVLKRAGRRRSRCRCLVTRRQSPRGLNTVCTSVVRQLDPMLARTNYQLIFHERGPGLRAPTTEYRLAKPVEKLVIHLPSLERTRFIFLSLFFFSVSRFFNFQFLSLFFFFSSTFVVATIKSGER